MSTIQIKDVTFAYDGGEPIFSNLQLTLNSDWRLGLVGRNGRGKTTLLRLLTGELQGQGSIGMGGLQPVYYPYAVSGESALEAAMQAAPQAEYWQLARELGLMHVSADVLERPYHTLSGGERAKLLLAALFLRQDGFLLIDEPTNHLDAEGRRAVSAYLSRKRGFIVVSHDRAFLDGCVDHILAINRNGVQVSAGNYSVWAAEREKTDASERRQNEKLKSEIADLQAAARRTADWSRRAEQGKYHIPRDQAADRGFIGASAARVMQRAKAAEKRAERAAEQKAGLLRQTERVDELRLDPLCDLSGPLICARDFAVCYDGKPAFAPLSFTLEKGQRLAVTGQNGCGKTSLLRAIAGLCAQSTGTLTRASRLQVSYLPQDTACVRGSLARFFADTNAEESFVRALLAKLEVRADSLRGDLADCSMGQKKKLLLCRSLAVRAHVYVWDEPLNYIDIVTRGQLQDMLLRSAATLVFTEHDAAFTDAVQTHRLSL